VTFPSLHITPKSTGTAAGIAANTATMKAGPMTHSDQFEAAVRSLKELKTRAEVDLEEAPAPARLAPFALALTAEVWADDPEAPADQVEAASGRFVLLHDPAGQDSWQGTFRIVAFVRSLVEREAAADPLLNDVAWSWLTESLDDVGAAHVALSGTITRTLSSSYGQIDERVPRGEIEMRCSWTLAGDGSTASAHAHAWLGLMTTAAGLPPMPADVTQLPRRR
jgi:hypothetical protein